MKKKKNGARDIAQKLLAMADVQINGSRPWDLQVHNDALFGRVLRQGPLGLAEAYMDGWWSAERLDECLDHLLSAKLDKKIKGDWRSIAIIISQIILNPQTKSKSVEVGERHYDLGNDLYNAMLDSRMVYSCGYWSGQTSPAQTLDQAQEAKMDLICKKLGLKPGQKILDIGCGWGSFAKYAAEKYGVSVVGVTISKEQASLARTIFKDLPVEIKVQDYRDIEGMFDHIVSIGMFEHVGCKNYRQFMQIVGEHLKEGGLFLLHTIGQNDTTGTTDPWVVKYIFPNSMLPSVSQVGKSIENIFIMEDWHNFGPDYDKTLLLWHENFKKSWPLLSEKYSQRFYRMWEYYLLGSAATFRCRNNQLWQIVLSKDGVKGGYIAVR